MAFTSNTFVPMSSMANSDAPRMFSYSSADTLATIKGAAYFSGATSMVGGPDNTNQVVMFIVGSDGEELAYLTFPAGVATVQSTVALT